MPKIIWLPCKNCGKVRKVYPAQNKYFTGLCATCYHQRHREFIPRGDKSKNWRGGKKIDSSGYIQIYLAPDAPFFPMAYSNGYVLEHRLVVAERLGRCLTPDELVHHLNGIRDDNRNENLVLVNRTNHPNKTFVGQLQQRIRELEKR